MLLDIEQSQLDGVTVLKLTGKLAPGREGQPTATLADRFVQDGHLKVVVDLTGVKYMDSVGIGVLAMAAGKLKEAGGRLALVSSPDGRTTQLLKLTQVNALVPLCATVDEALAELA